MKHPHHLGRINSVINYVSQNLDRDLSLRRLADVAALSPFHFHRIFNSICEETPHDFVTRKRIEKIAETILAQSETVLAEVSLRFGFENPTSFSRSFKRYFGMSPSAFRKQKKGPFNRVVRQKEEEAISIERYIERVDLAKQWLLEHGQVEVRTLRGMDLASIVNKGPFEEVYAAFGRLYAWASEAGLISKENAHRWLMVIHDNPAITSESMMMQSACLQSEVPFPRFSGEVVSMEIPRGNFLVGHFELSAEEDFRKAWDGMSIWTFDHNLKTRDGYYFELFYTDSLLMPNQKHVVDICIPVA